eukprot:m.1075633 g.1075633  ORF g.1075633 m.1075633 type:complete len:890 (+) comp24243_c0_seq1:40-2709(+)
MYFLIELALLCSLVRAGNADVVAGLEPAGFVFSPVTCSFDNLGCYFDGADKRLLEHEAQYVRSPNAGDLSLESCVGMCIRDGYNESSDVYGVEYGGQCFCDHSLHTNAQHPKEPDTDCQQMKCSGNASEYCGGSDRIFVYKATCNGIPPAPSPSPPPQPSVPAYHGCADNISSALPYCDVSLSYQDRVNDILSRINLTEKIALLSPTIKPFCSANTLPINRIGLPRYRWLVEANSCIDSGCLGGSCNTIFVSPNAMAASFNRTSWWHKGDVVSTDLRVANNYGDGSKTGQIGLTGFGPNINMVKDPRYGRNSELPGEDPFLSGSYAAAYTAGMQQMSQGKRPHLKMLSYLKHYTAYSVEASRFTFSANVTQFDFWDSYLPQFEYAFTHGDNPTSGAMCSYFAPNGISSCGNNWLLNELIRTQWSRPDAVIMSDCSAVANMDKNGYAHSPQDACAKAVNAGMDVYGGWDDNLYGQGYLAQAIEQHLTTEALVTQAVNRTLMQKMKVGIFDPVEDQTWTKLTTADLNTSYAQQVAFEAALQGQVLLKNDGNTLPLKTGVKLAVVGPMATDPSLYHSDYVTAAVPSFQYSIAAALAKYNVGGTTTSAEGVDVSGRAQSDQAAALAMAKAADVVVLAIGIAKAQEHEGMDRADTLLPGDQLNFSLDVLAAAAGKPVVLVTVSGGILSIDKLVGPSQAIIDAFNPSQVGPLALAAQIFGVENRWGKLPVTIYPANYSAQLDITDMSFATAPGRSYRYYSGNPLFTFGDGLSLTEFEHTCGAATLSKDSQNVSVTCTVKNTGSRTGDEVLMCFHAVSDDIRKSADHPVPFKRLVEFERVGPLAAGTSSASVTFSVPVSRFGLVTNSGDTKVYPGVHTLIVSRGFGREVNATIALK